MPGLAGVPVARGAPHAAMLCQQTALMPSICSVTYIKCMLLSLSPQSSEPWPPARHAVRMRVRVWHLVSPAAMSSNGDLIDGGPV